MISPPDAIVGQNIRQWAVRLLAYIRSERVLSGDGVLVKQTGNGKTLTLADRRSDYVRIAGRKVEITGARSRYIWVNVTNNTAQWSSVDMDPMPDGIEIYDTYVNEINIPRLG